MAQKRMLVINTDVINKIDENRGDMNRSDFISFLIDSCLMEESEKQNNLTVTKEDSENQNHVAVTKEDFDSFQQGTKDLLRNFLEFFISYGLELGKRPEDKTFEELNQKLQKLGNSASKAKNP